MPSRGGVPQSPAACAGVQAGPLRVGLCFAQPTHPASPPPTRCPAPADEVAWLFNLRGGDVPYNPVFISYGVVTAEGAALYVDVAKVTPE